MRAVSLLLALWAMACVTEERCVAPGPRGEEGRCPVVDDTDGGAGDGGELADASDRDLGPLPDAGACPDSGVAVAGGTAIDVDTVWACPRYEVGGVVTIEARLTIRAGVELVFVNGPDEAGYLDVAPTGRLDVLGSDEEPVLMRHEPATPGSWSGILLRGNARARGSPHADTGLPYGNLGSPDDTHSCGVLDHVRMEHTGAPYGIDTPTERDGALTVAGCGTGTVLSTIHIVEPLEDGVRVYGGGPRLSQIAVDGSEGNGLHFTDDFFGQIQFLYVRQLGPHAAVLGNGFLDNANGGPAIPLIYNVTAVIENGSGHGLVTPAIASARYVNFLVAGASDLYETCATVSGASADAELVIQRFAGHGCTTVFDGPTDPPFWADQLFAANDPNLGANLRPAEGWETGLPMAAATPPDSLDSTGTYYGAFAPGVGDTWLSWSTGIEP